MTKRSKILTLVVILLIVLGVGVLLINNDDNSASNNSNSSTVGDPNFKDPDLATPSEQKPVDENPGEQNSDLAGPITKAQVELHNKESDCWTIIDGTVYDITSYVPQHPGGDEILRACGSDGTSLFQQRTTESGEKVGTGRPHSSSANSQLEKLKIGVLAN
jgi:cytochrome b involved in lipid metabolism